MIVGVRTSTIKDKRPFSQSQREKERDRERENFNHQRQKAGFTNERFSRGARDGGCENFNHQRPNQITIYRNF
jgi:hypothetical protein